MTVSAFAQQPSIADLLTGLESELTSASDLDEAISKELNSRIDQGKGLLQEAQGHAAESLALESAAASAADDRKRFEDQLADVRLQLDEELPPLAENLPLEEIVSRLALAQAERKSLADRRDTLRAYQEEWPQRRERIQKRVAELKPETDTLGRAPLGAEATLEQRIAAAVSMARREAQAAEYRRMELELLGYPARLEVQSLEMAWLVQALKLADRSVEQYQHAVEQARASDVQKRLENTTELESRLADVAPALREYAAGNRSYAEQLQKFAAIAERAAARGAAMQAQLESIEQDFSLMRQRVELAGRKEVLGRVMITRLKSLPNVDQIQREKNTRDDLIAEISLAYIDDDEALRQLQTGPDAAAALAATAGPAAYAPPDVIEELIGQRRELLQRSLRSERDLVRSLVKNSKTASSLALIAGEFNRFLTGNLMWIRDFSFLSLQTALFQAQILLNPASWLALPAQLHAGFHTHPWTAPMLLLLMMVVLTHRSLRSIYDERMAAPALLNATTLINILLGLILASLLSLPSPLLLYTLGMLLDVVRPSTTFLEAFAPALKFSALVLYLLLLLRRLIHAKGVGRRLLKWDARLLDTLRAELSWSGPVLVLAASLDVFAYHLDVVSTGGPMGALCTGLISATLALIGVRLLRDPLINEGGTSRIVLLVMVAFAGLLVLMLMLGLLFPAELYLESLALTILLFLGVKTLSDVMERALLILRARLTRKAREELKAREEEGEDVDLEVGDLVDVVSLSEAHTKLLLLVRLVGLVAGLWLIWSPSLPAYDLLEAFTLWEVVDVTADSGIQIVTLMDLAMCIVLLVITALLAKHLPSLVQVFLLEWVDVSAGARYASSILLQYVVVAVGLSSALAMVGWDWSRLQWLVAALGVGIGFGLQEIVANFISGIIILFERPIRVGDIITVAEAEGTVKSISARATVIQTFEGKEILVPNKELITGQVINWTLSETAIRVVIPVGVAYGSDVRLAMHLMQQTAVEHPLVHTDPEPTVTFEDFGDNALLLWLRCYVSDERLRVCTEMRTVINDKFADAGLVIAFPQRDIHLDTSAPLQVEIQSASGTARPGELSPTGG